MQRFSPCLSGALLALLLLGHADFAEAQRCKYLYTQAFSALGTRDFRLIEQETHPADLQLKLDTEIYALFGARPQRCEEGAYSLFLERFQSYATAALRAPKDEKTVRIRAAISIIRQSPESLEFPQAASEAAQFRLTSRDIRTVAQETGMSPLARQLVDTIDSIGPPVALSRAETPVPVAQPEPVPPPPPARRPEPAPVRAPVETVSVPTEPLPGWAVISLYEIEQHAKHNETGPILGKVQAILRWMKAVAPPPPP